MELTEIHIKLANPTPDDSRLLGFASVTLDDVIAVRDIKIINGPKGRFLSMPSRKETDPCPECQAKNHRAANYCNDCGSRLHHDTIPLDRTGRAKLYSDIVFPINLTYRRLIEQLVLEAYDEAVLRASKPALEPVAAVA